MTWRDEDRPEYVPKAVWDAYGPRYPGGGKRWLDQRAEREARVLVVTKPRPRRSAPLLWLRVHPGTTPPGTVELHSFREENANH